MSRVRARVLRALSAAVLLVLSASACTLIHREEGRPLPADLSVLEVGRTTKAQALALLGAPVSVRRQFDGDLYTWRRREADSRALLLIPVLEIYHRIQAEDREDRVSLLFGSDGLLAGLGVSRELLVDDP